MVPEAIMERPRVQPCRLGPPKMRYFAPDRMQRLFPRLIPGCFLITPPPTLPVTFVTVRSGIESDTIT